MANLPEAIAIVGSGCRFPGHANSPSKLWKLLQNPRDLRVPITPERFNTKGFYHEDGQYHGHHNVKDSYLLSGEGTQRHFDAQFFGINASEANSMDPQLRLLLETVYESVEAAGLTIDGLQGSDTAVYAGLMIDDYSHVMLRDQEYMANYHVTGTARSLVSNRVSYFFDWHGPSMTIDTACSSSMVAVHQAVQQLRSGRSRVAVAAGANLLLDTQLYVSASKLKMLSPHSRSRMWDADADGYAKGEGVASVVLKRLSDALADGDDIDCIIRETGLNQDGKTPGITMPSSSAQAKLIRECYASIGLDPTNPEHRPQYFEAHGTGTQAGDPVEAEAISQAFFSNPNGQEDEANRLFVGGIKTLIGHTEGTAGLAGLIKTALALKHARIPSNLLFNNLNPKIEPFWGNLRLPVTESPWPTNSDVRRASVNSFGFGGTNAHAILEYHDYVPFSSRDDTPVFAPFVFSAASDTSLVSYLATLADHLRQNESTTSLRDLAYTLYSRRSRFAFSTSIAASTTSELCDRIEERLKAAKDANQPLGVRASNDGQTPKILGVFTGQGAQWARQGYELVAGSEVAKRILLRMEKRLAQLPKDDRPAWSLLEELSKSAEESRIAEPILSQPLCTAIQILQVDLLRATGVEFSAVVGHSSGEIGAAYAAGFISAEDAICIAYYRGFHSELARGPDGQDGAMMAVKATHEDAQELCEKAEFKGRVCVAAVNSAASVTLSGDKDAIQELQVILDEGNTWARALKVSKAYHSHHMQTCSEPYLKSLADLDIQVQHGNECTWFSSVDGGSILTSDDGINGRYWNENLSRPVSFMQAVQGACASLGPFQLAVEVGPHPALKGPALQNIQDVSESSVPYTGLLSRGKNDVEAIAEGLGFVWTQLGKGSVDLGAYDEFMTEGKFPCRVAKDLPSYAWNHDLEYWHESRYARAIRERDDSVHQLLGHLTPDSTEQEMKWRHLIRPKEIPWLKGHCLQGQTVYPAAGYIASALEAASQLCKDSSLDLIEVLDLDIGKAMAFDSDESTTEAIFSLTDIVKTNGKVVDANFKYNAGPADKYGESLELKASGRIRVSLGAYSSIALPPRSPRQTNLLKVSTEDFYESLAQLEYQYSNPFDALSGLERRLGASTGHITIQEQTDLLIHPAVLDASIQSILLAQSAPRDGRLWSMHVPKTIQRVRVNPQLCAAEMKKGEPLPFDAIQPYNLPTIAGDVDIFPSNSDHAMIQLEGIDCVPFTGATAKDDTEMFGTTAWSVAGPDAELVGQDDIATSEDWELAHLLERISVFYLRRLHQAIPNDHPSRQEGPYVNLFTFTSYILEQTKSGELTFWKSEWDQDTVELIQELCEPYMDDVGFKLLCEMGENLIDIARGDKSGIETGMKDNMLTEYYEKALGLPVCTQYLARTVKQISHRYPRMDILEIGAGTGGATKRIFSEIGQKFGSYTFTDISSGFFDAATEVFDTQKDKMNFKVLDAGKDPLEQGFKEQSYDIVVASLVLHATACLEDTMRNVRRLLKPGGYLVMLEGHANNIARLGAVFGAFPGWWVGGDDGRVLSPFITSPAWDALLYEVGFSGCDSMSSEMDGLVKPFSVYVSQAVDDRVSLLREPLSAGQDLFKRGDLTRHLVLLGGTTLKSSRIIVQLKSLLKPYVTSIQTVPSLEELAKVQITALTTVLSLSDLDEPFFKRPTEVRWAPMKNMLSEAGRIFWVTSGRRADQPYANMTLGLVRSLIRELPALEVQFFDVEDPQRLNSRSLAEDFLRFNAGLLWQGDDTQEPLLNTVEPEIVNDKEGRSLIPRLMVSEEMNNRYNSSRRPILADAQLETHNVRVSYSEANYSLERISMPDKSKSRMRITHSLLTGVRVSELGCMFLVLGEDCEYGDQLVALSTQNALISRPWKDLSVSTDVDVGSEAEFLTAVAHYMLASVMLKGLTKGDSVLVHEPSPAFAEVLTREAELAEAKVTFSTCKFTDRGWSFIHPTAPDRVIQGLNPKQYSVFADLARNDGSRSVSARICSQLSAYCRRENPDTLFGREAWDPLGFHIDDIRARLQDAAGTAQDSLSVIKGEKLPVDTIEAQILSESEAELQSETVIEWTSSSNVPIQVQPIDAQLLFSDSKTYWLAGLTGGLGLSLCEWMVHRGARQVVLSSRNPKIDQSWMTKMADLGAVVKALPCDFSNRDDVNKVHKEILETMPAFGGIAQGAMVLQDTPFRDMTLEGLTKVMQPKVDGSIYLDDLFKDESLDFFVFFSSIAAVTGNMGQSNYSAANMFMASLAEQRRQRGQAASVIHIGPVLGVGYIAQQNIDPRVLIQTQGHRFMSEQDVHQLFAEAVVAGRPGSSDPIDITTGLRRVAVDENSQPSWANNPFLSHFIKNREGAENSSSVTKSNVSVKTQLSEAGTLDEVANIIREAFIPKLATLYQLDAEKLAQQDMETMHLDSMGTDSLLAVEIRSWFMKTLQVNIPVLKILGGASVGDLVKTATETIPSALVPAIQPDSDDIASVHSKSQHSPGLDSTSGVSSTSESEDVMSQSSQTEVEDTKDDVPTPIILKTAKLAFSQEMFWFVSTFLDDKAALNHTSSIRLTGKFRQVDFERAVRSLCQQHESLRTRFYDEDGQGLQGVMDSGVVTVERRNIHDEAEVANVFDELHRYTYDISRGESIRLIVLPLSPTVNYLLIGGHGLAMDGTSFQVMLKDLLQHYTFPGKVRHARQFLDFSEKQHQDFKAGKFSKELQFWKQELTDLPPPLPILRVSQTTSRPNLQSWDNERVDIRISREVKAQISALCRNARATPFHFYLAAFRALLARQANAEDVCIGIGDANRMEDDMMDSIGVFVNLLPLRFRTAMSTKFVDLLKEAKSKAYAALANSKIPFQVLLNELDVPRNATHAPIFQAFVDYRQGQREKQSWGDCTLELLSFKASKMAYDVALDIIDDPNGECLIMMIVRKDMYSQEETQRLASSYEHLIKSFAEEAAQTLDSRPAFSPSHIDKALAFGRGTIQKPQWLETIIHKVDEIAISRPDELAVGWGLDQTASYSQLINRANAIAFAMQEYGIIPGHRVAVLQEATLDWVASILAIWRLGAVYLPLDLGNPWSRLASITSTCIPTVILIDNDTAQDIENLEAPHIGCINVSASVDGGVKIPIAAKADELAVLYYTSGSTGAPKGIALKHGGLRNWFEAAAVSYDMGVESVLQQSSSAFDMSMMELFTALNLGGCAHIVPRKLRGDARAITELIYAKGITWTWGCPSEYASWFQYGDRNLLSQSKWRRAFSGGEFNTESLIKQFADLSKPDLRLFNMYGPTEVSYYATSTEINYRAQDGLSQIPVGNPLPNYTVYVVDDAMKLVAPGVQGEIYIGGAGLAVEYLGNKALTDERFVSNMFATAEDISLGWDKLHRTGDVGRWTDDGKLLMEGRTAGDTQVKLRGLRIDLREVENAMIAAAGGALSQAVVTARKTHQDGPDVLVAHISFNPAVAADQHRTILKSLPSRLMLPRYACPAIIIPIEKMPLTNTQKLDRRAIAELSLPERDQSKEGNEVKLTEGERKLKGVWEEVIGNKVADLHEFGPDADFFHVGGTSLLLLGLQAKVRDAFDVELPLPQMFDSSTLSAMAQRIEKTQDDRIICIDWDQEAALTPKLAQNTSGEIVGEKKGKIVVLTGASGYLGGGLLKALIHDPDVATVHCIAIRNVESRTHLHGLEKVVLYEGDLIDPRLGLSEEDAHKIFSTADTIIHNGADISYMKKYSSMRLPNVDSTKKLAEMSFPRMVPLHFVSTAGACSFAIKTTQGDDSDVEVGLGPVSLAAHPPPTDGSQGYASSKWASEVFLEKLYKHYNGAWPVFVHRPSLIGRSEVPQLDLAHNLQHYSRVMKAAPIDRSAVKGQMDLVTLDTVVQGILESVQHENTSQTMDILHHIGGVDLPMDDMRTWGLEGEENVEELSYQEWATRAGEAGMHATLVAFLQSFGDGGKAVFPKLLK